MKISGNGHPRTHGVAPAAVDDAQPEVLFRSRAALLFFRPLGRYLASVLSGLALVACFPALGWRPLVWVALLPLLLAVVHETRLARGFLLGYLTGVVFFGGSCYWFTYVTEHYGGLRPVLAFGVLASFVLLISALFGLFGLLETLLARRSAAWAIAISPFLWVAIELLRTYFFTGFPWNLLGYALPGTGLRQLASVTGVYGLSFLAAATAALLVSAWLNPMGRWSWGMPVLWFVLLGVTNWTSGPPALPPPTEQAYLVQPDAPLEEAGAEQWAPWVNPEPLHRLAWDSILAACKESPIEVEDFLPECTRQPSEHPPLIVWSESPAPFYYSRDPVFRSTIQEVAQRSGAYVVFNTVNYDGRNDTLPANSAMALDPGGRLIMRYDKIHLVPFGEYVPWWGLPGVVGKITSEVGDFVPGRHFAAAVTRDGSIAVPICYEDIFPQLVRRLVPPGPGVLVVISNDSWYGDTPAAAQHLEMARLRAIENGRYLLRSTNDGITAAIDPYGRVIERLPRHRQQVLAVRFSYLGQQTFYHAHGDVFAWLCLVVSVGLLGLGLSRTRA